MPFAFITMKPLDWGLTGAAILLLVFAIRALVSGKGRAQMGLGFGIVAAVILSLALGRRLADFTILDGLRVATGVLLLVPVLRVLFSNTGGSITTAVISLILAAVIAGPVVAPFVAGVDGGVAPEVTRLERQVEEVSEELAGLEATRDQVAAFAATERAKLTAMGKSGAEEVAADPRAMETLEKYARYKEKLDELTRDITTLEQQRTSLQAALRALEQGANVQQSMADAERIRAEVEDEAARREERSLVENYSKKGAALEVYEQEFGGGK